MNNHNNKKAENFKRLAESRTEKAISMIDLIGNLSNPFFYEYSEDQVNKIFKAITDALKQNKKKFNKRNKKKGRKFTL